MGLEAARALLLPSEASFHVWIMYALNTTSMVSHSSYSIAWQVETQPINIEDVPVNLPPEPVFDSNTPKKFVDMVGQTGDQVSCHATC